MILERNGITIGVYHFSDRKRPMLGVCEGNVITAVASFSSEENAEFYDEAMRKFLDGMIKEQDHE